MEKEKTLKDKVQEFYKDPTQEKFDELKKDKLAFRLILEKNLQKFIKFFNLFDLREANVYYELKKEEQIIIKEKLDEFLKPKDFKTLCTLRSNFYTKYTRGVGHELSKLDQEIENMMCEIILEKATTLEEYKELYENYSLYNISEEKQQEIFLKIKEEING